MKKTKVLLVFPSLTVHPSDYPLPHPPLGLAYLAAVLEKHKFPVKILDALALGINKAKKKKGGFLKVGLGKKEIKKAITDFKPQLVGVWCGSTTHADDSHEVASWAKEVDPKILVVFGGAHATLCPASVLEDANVDLIVTGEGEITLLELVKRLEAGKSFSGLIGTCQRKRGKMVVNPRRKFIDNLDDLPLPARHLLPMEVYLRGQAKTRDFSMRTPRTAMLTSRGCVMNCYFCSVNVLYGRTWRPRSPESVVEEMEHLIEVYGVREFYMLDDNVAIDKKRVIKICELIGKKGLDIRWTCPSGTAIWMVNEEVLTKMKKSGVYRLTFGIESGCPKTLKTTRKPIMLDRVKKTIALCNQLGFWTASTFIIGFPKETREDIEETINWVINSGLDFAAFYVATPYPGTDLRKEFVEEGLLKEKEKMRYVSVNVASYDTGHFTVKELSQLKNEALNRFFTSQVEHYLNPLYSLPHLGRKIKSLEELAYLMRVVNNAVGMKIQALKGGKFQTHYIDKND